MTSLAEDIGISFWSNIQQQTRKPRGGNDNADSLSHRGPQQIQKCVPEGAVPLAPQSEDSLSKLTCEDSLGKSLEHVG
jgi:hypothetical protein